MPIDEPELPTGAPAPPPLDPCRLLSKGQVHTCCELWPFREFPWCANCEPDRAPAPPPLDRKPRSIELLRDTLRTLARTIWDKRVPEGKHLWSIPVDKDRDWDCILSDAIDELEALRAAAATASPRLEMQVNKEDKSTRGDGE